MRFVLNQRHRQWCIETRYYLLTRKQADLGANYFDERDAQRVRKRLVGRLERLGYHVVIQKAA